MAEPSTFSETEVNNLTLRYFTNPVYYSEIGSGDKEVEAQRHRDVKFYRRRILAFTKQMFRGGAANKSVKSAFDNYVNSVVAHLKMSDTKDILQTEYIGLPKDESLELTAEEVNCKLDEANYSMMKKQLVGGTLDSFVTTSGVENKEIPPKLKTINLLDPKLRTKGIKNKKRKDNLGT